MRICLFAKSTSDHGMGGMETHFESLHKNLLRLGHQVIVLTTRHPQYQTRNYVHGSVTYFLKVPTRRYSGKWWQESLKMFSELHEKTPFDIVFSQSLSASALRHQPNHPPIYMFAYGLTRWHIRSEWKQCKNPFDYFRWLVIKIPEILYYTYAHELPLFRHAEAVISEGHTFKDDLRKYARKVILSYNGVDVEQFHPDHAEKEKIREELGIPQDAQVVVMGGVISLQKGMQIGMQAFKNLSNLFPNLFLLVVGEGPALADLLKFVSREGIQSRILFSGRIEHDRMHDYLNAGEIFWHPSLRMEGMPSIIIEAMACGLVPVATNIGGTASAIESGKNGILIPPGDSGELERVTKGLLDHPNQMKELARSAREKAEGQFDYHQIVERLLMEIQPAIRA